MVLVYGLMQLHCVFWPALAHDIHHDQYFLLKLSIHLPESKHVSMESGRSLCTNEMNKSPQQIFSIGASNGWIEWNKNTTKYSVQQKQWFFLWNNFYEHGPVDLYTVLMCRLKIYMSSERTSNVCRQCLIWYIGYCRRAPHTSHTAHYSLAFRLFTTSLTIIAVCQQQFCQ